MLHSTDALFRRLLPFLQAAPPLSPEAPDPGNPGGATESRYFRHDSESRLGEGVAWTAFGDDGWATRQVERYGDKWFCSIIDYCEEIGGTLCDQPLSTLDLSDSVEIRKEEFEVAWQQALRYMGRTE